MAQVRPGRSGETGRFAWPVRRRMPGPAGTAEDIAAQDVAEREAADRRLPPPEPVPMLDPPPRFTLAAFRLAALGLALVLTVGITMARLLVGGPPSVAQLRAQAGIDAWTELPIGVKFDQPGTAFRDGNMIWRGFDIDIAYMIAEDLGFRRDEVTFYAIESEDRARMQATDIRNRRVPVKLVIASYSITEKRKKDGVRFSAPYLYTEQSVLTLHSDHHSPVSTLKDLKGERVCSISASTSVDPASNAGATVVPRNLIRQCIEDLRKHRVTAVTTDAAILAGYKAKYPKEFDHWDLGFDATEAWGINVGENPALQKLVDLSLYQSWADPKDARWEEAYRNNLQTEVEKNGATPIAVAEQPRVARPDVRHLPWENLSP